MQVRQNPAQLTGSLRLRLLRLFDSADADRKPKTNHIKRSVYVQDYEAVKNKRNNQQTSQKTTTV